MILYKDNNTLDLSVVTTVKGDREYKINCKKINDIYYTKDRDIFYIESEDKWYRLSNKICFDYELKKMVLLTDDLLYGVVEIQNDTFIFGRFTPNVYNNVVVSNNNISSVVINQEILEQNNFFERITTGIWYNKSQVSELVQTNYKSIGSQMSHSNKHLKYTIEENTDFETRLKAFNKYPTKISREVLKYSEFIGDLTAGFEAEVSVGFIPTHLLYRLGLVEVRDGSVGTEFVSVPFSGAKGLQNICNSMDVLRDYCNIDISCSLHYHVGNISTERLNVVVLYILAYKIQDDIFKMFPYYKTDPTGIKAHNYCKKLKCLNIHPLQDLSQDGYKSYVNEVYRNIFIYFSDGVVPDQNNNRLLNHHPIGAKWNQKNRRSWVNLCNLLFSPRRTVEFRLK